jgi:hypothetical protein
MLVKLAVRREIHLQTSGQQLLKIRDQLAWKYNIKMDLTERVDVAEGIRFKSWPGHELS